MGSPIKVLDNGAEPQSAGPVVPQVEIVVPVQHDEQGLAPSIRRLHALHHVSARLDRAAEMTVLVPANLVATALRYTLYRSWVFRGRSAPPLTASPPEDTETPQSGLATLAQPNRGI